MVRQKDTASYTTGTNVSGVKVYQVPVSAGDPKTISLSYDNKKNPLGETNIATCVKTFFSDDIDRLVELTTNNLMQWSGNYGIYPSSVVRTYSNYEYSTNDYPLKATRTDVYTSPSVTMVFALRFEYY